jgi:hypothetical protein
LPPRIIAEGWIKRNPLFREVHKTPFFGLSLVPLGKTPFLGM